eukprot:443142-Rhodomonas_salina.5
MQNLCQYRTWRSRCMGHRKDICRTPQGTREGGVKLISYKKAALNIGRMVPAIGSRAQYQTFRSARAGPTTARYLSTMHRVARA